MLTTALYSRFTSRGEADFGDKVLSAMRWGFGGHVEGAKAAPQGGGPMSGTLAIRPDGAFDLLALGGLVMRLDTGLVPFRKAHEAAIHVSGAEYNVAANLADCFGLRTAIATAMVDYPVGDLVAERVRAAGVTPLLPALRPTTA